MDMRPPHDIVASLADVPPEQRKHFRRLAETEALALGAMTPEQRARWLAEHPIDAEKLALAEAKRQRKLFGRPTNANLKEALTTITIAANGMRNLLSDVRDTILEIVADASREFDTRPSPGLNDLIRRLNLVLDHNVEVGTHHDD